MFIVMMQIIKLLVLYAVYTLIDHAYMHCLSNLRVKNLYGFMQLHSIIDFMKD